MSEDLPATRAADGPGIRAADEDRERLVAELHEHTVAGRLSSDELEQRLGRAYAARTTAELDSLRSDLPASREALSHELHRRRSRLRRRLVQETGGSLSLFVVASVIWLASGAHGQFWPVWILVVVLLSFARNGRALVGPEPDLDEVERRLESRRARRARRDERRGHRRLGP